MFHKDKLSDTLAITMSKFCIDVCLLYVVLSSSSQGYEVLELVPGSEYREGKKRKKKRDRNLEKLPVHRRADVDAGWQMLDCFTFMDNLWSLFKQACIKSELWQVKQSSCRTPRSGDWSFPKKRFSLQSVDAAFLCALHKNNGSTGKWPNWSDTCVSPNWIKSSY